MSRIVRPQPEKVNDVSCIVCAMDAGSELRYLILGAQREGNRALTELLKPIGVTPSQAEVLSVLADAERPLSVRDVGERLVCETGSPSRLVSSLVTAGLVARESHPDDARAVSLSLTAEGRRTAKEVAKVDAAISGLITSLYSEREITAMTRSLRKFVDDLPAGRALAKRSERASGQAGERASAR
jgi:MarR family transcriptional regulator, organic hydroperoxide resistance regulator